MKTLSQNFENKLINNEKIQTAQSEKRVNYIPMSNKDYLLKTILEKNYGHLYKKEKQEK